MEVGHLKDRARFSLSSYSETDEVARTVYAELAALADEEGFLTTSMADASMAIVKKTELSHGAFRTAREKLQSIGAIEKKGERSETRWLILPLEEEQKEAQGVSDETLVFRLNEKLSELELQKQEAKQRLSEAQAVVEEAAREIESIDSKKPEVEAARDRLAGIVAARQAALDLLS